MAHVIEVTAKRRLLLVMPVTAIFQTENRSFRNLASKGFPSGCSESVYVCPPALRKLQTYGADFSNDA